MRVVGRRFPAYLPGMTETVARHPLSRPLIVAIAAVGIVLVGTVLLWAHYGATVFFETIRAGFVACFG